MLPLTASLLCNGYCSVRFRLRFDGFIDAAAASRLNPIAAGPCHDG
jgi:hypothetical protein